MRQGSRLSPWLGAVLAHLAVSTAAFAQSQVITGKVSAEGGVPTPTATVYIEELGIGVQTNVGGAYTLTVPATRLTGKSATLRARVIGYRPDAFPITLSAGRIEHDFVLKADINRLSEVVVTGSIEGTERSKVPFAVGRLTTDDVPVPSSNPLTALSGKVAGMRIAQSDGQPGSSPQIMMRGPTSINVTGRNQSPLIIVDGVIMRVGSLEEIGGLDIESVEAVKGAAGASLYGSTAANGVILIKTKRGGTQDGVRFNVRSELGMNDLNSTAYGQAQFHLLGMDETGTRFCVQGAGAIGNCSRTMDFMQEILRINNVNADTVRTPQTFQYSTPSASTGQLQNTFQAGIWPGQYYNSLARVSTSNQVKITSVDATGRAGLVQFFVSGAYTDDPGSLKYLKGQQQARGRMNMDFDARSDLRLSVRSVFDQGTTDLNTFAFGAIYRGLPAGFDALALDSLGRPLLRSGGVGIKGSNNGQLNALYNAQNESNMQESQRVLASGAVSYTPMEWLDVEGTMGYDTRRRSSSGLRGQGIPDCNFVVSHQPWEHQRRQQLHELPQRQRVTNDPQAAEVEPRQQILRAGPL